jgi:hypothetical protein
LGFGCGAGTAGADPIEERKLLIREAASVCVWSRGTLLDGLLGDGGAVGVWGEKTLGVGRTARTMALWSSVRLPPSDCRADWISD